MVRKTLKRALFFVTYYTGSLYLLILVLKKLKKQHRVAILFYHRFSEASFDFGQLPHLDIRDFKKQMRHIKRWYRVVTMDELAGRLASRNSFVSPSVVISVDDGYVNNYTLAYPVIKALGLPAIVYLTTGFIGTNKAPWVDDLMDMLFSTKAEALSLPELLGERVLNISTRSRKKDAAKILFNAMLRLEHKRKLLMMQKLSKSLGTAEMLKNGSKRKMLNWNEVIEMGKDNITFGAHTVSHPTLSKMDVGEAEREIRESKEEIETQIGAKVRHFAIPNGKIEDFSEALKKYCSKIGMSTVVSTEPGVVYKESDPYFLGRVNPPPPIYVFACELARHLFFSKTP